MQNEFYEIIDNKIRGLQPTFFTFMHSNNGIAPAIPDNVVLIGDNMFKGIEELRGFESVSSSLRTIGWHCFYDCKNLESFPTTNALKFVKGSAFYNCEKLKELYIPATIEEIRENAFYNCKDLKVNFFDKFVVNYVNSSAIDAPNFIEGEKVAQVFDKNQIKKGLLAIRLRDVMFAQDVQWKEYKVNIEDISKVYNDAETIISSMRVDKYCDFVSAQDTLRNLGVKRALPPAYAILNTHDGNEMNVLMYYKLFNKEALKNLENHKNLNNTERQPLTTPEKIEIFKFAYALGSFFGDMELLQKNNLSEEQKLTLIKEEKVRARILNAIKQTFIDDFNYTSKVDNKKVEIVVKGKTFDEFMQFCSGFVPRNIFDSKFAKLFLDKENVKELLYNSKVKELLIANLYNNFGDICEEYDIYRKGTKGKNNNDLFKYALNYNDVENRLGKPNNFYEKLLIDNIGKYLSNIEQLGRAVSVVNNTVAPYICMPNNISTNNTVTVDLNYQGAEGVKILTDINISNFDFTPYNQEIIELVKNQISDTDNENRVKYYWAPKSEVIYNDYDNKNVICGNIITLKDILGYRTCASFGRVGYPILVHTMLDSTTQMLELLINDKNIGKATFRLNPEKGEALFNNLEVSNPEYLSGEDRQSLFYAIKRGTEALVKVYNANNPEHQIHKVNIGVRANKVDLKPFTVIASGDNWIDPEPLAYPRYPSDAKGEQLVIYNPELEKKLVNGEYNSYTESETNKLSIQVANVVEEEYIANPNSEISEIVRDCKRIARHYKKQGVLSYYRKVEKDNVLVYAKKDNVVVGYVSLLPNRKNDEVMENALTIAQTAVHPDYKRQGVCSTLYKYVIDMAKENYSHIFASVKPSNLASRKFHASLGFIEVDKSPTGETIRLEKEINPTLAKNIKTSNNTLDNDDATKNNKNSNLDSNLESLPNKSNNPTM